MILEFFMGLLALLVVIFSTLIIYARWNYGTLEAMGIPVLKPHWFLGSLHNALKTHYHREDVERLKTLGPVYGVYEGRAPAVVISDPEMIYKILFTESEHFEKRVQDFGSKVMSENIEFQRGEKWRTIHSVLSPVFTSGKLKMQCSVIPTVVEESVEYLRSKMDKDGRVSKVDLHEFIAPFLIQLIAEMLCGIKISEPRDPDNSFVKNMRKSLFDGWKIDWMFNLFQVFPFLQKILSIFDMDGIEFLVDHINNILDERERLNINSSDAVSTLLELRNRVKSDPDFKRLEIPMESVYAQGFEFFAASFGGVTTTVKELFYFLVTNPEAYEKVLKEIEAVEKKHGKFTYETVAEMEYLEACISETLRLFPAFARLERECVKDWSYEGFKLKKGIVVTFPMFAVHHNPDLFPEPNKFKPERFMPENKDKVKRCSFLPFGQGQRQCMGRRLAYPIMKIFTSKILSEFMLEKRIDTEWVESKGTNFFVTLDPIFLDFVKRTK